MAWAVLLLPPPVFTVSWRLYAVSGLDIFIGLEFLKLEKCLLNLCPDAETDAVFTAVLSAAADKSRRSCGSGYSGGIGTCRLHIKYKKGDCYIWIYKQ